MKVAIDIDGTLCWSNLPVFLEECNTAFDLKIDQATLATIDSKQALYALPEVEAARRVHAYLDDELAWIEYRERCILESLLIEDAVEGVAKLAQLGEIEYFTARYNEIPEIQQEIEKATKQWLKCHNFINPGKVIFCDQIEDKVLKMLKIAENDTIILIDDSYKSVLRETKRLEANAYALLRKRMTLVAVRAAAYELPSTELNVIALPYWDEIDSVIERIQYHGRKRQTKAAKAPRDAAATASTGDTQANDATHTGHRQALTRSKKA